LGRTGETDLWSDLGSDDDAAPAGGADIADCSDAFAGVTDIADCPDAFAGVTDIADCSDAFGGGTDLAHSGGDLVRTGKTDL